MRCSGGSFEEWNETTLRLYFGIEPRVDTVGEIFLMVADSYQRKLKKALATMVERGFATLEALWLNPGIYVPRE
jgi:hypothetical protein